MTEIEQYMTGLGWPETHGLSDYRCWTNPGNEWEIVTENGYNWWELNKISQRKRYRLIARGSGLEDMKAAMKKMERGESK